LILMNKSLINELKTHLSKDEKPSGKNTPISDSPN